MTTRRNLLFGIGGLGAAAFATKGSAATISRPGTAFGTIVNVRVTARDEMQANLAIDAAYAEIRSVHKAASLFDPQSEVSRLNATGRLHQPSHVLTEIVSASDRLHGTTNGAFDPSIQPLWALWAKGVPDKAAMDEALRRVGWKNLQAAGGALWLANAASLSFNGIAQGYAADRVLAALLRARAVSAAIDTGEAGRLNTDQAIAIQHPRKPGAIGTIAVTDGFAAVSGDYASAFTPDFLHHHIFDPRLGFSPHELASVAVTAASGAMADGLATAFMVMGAARSMDCLRKLSGCEALFIDKTGGVTLSPGMHQLYRSA